MGVPVVHGGDTFCGAASNGVGLALEPVVPPAEAVVDVGAVGAVVWSVPCVTTTARVLA